MSRILIATGLYPPEVGGPATHAKLLFDELPPYGFEVVVLPFRVVRHLPKVVRHLAYFFKVLRRGKDVHLIYALDAVSVGFPAACAAFILRKRLWLRVPGDYAWEQGVQRFGVTDTLVAFSKKEEPYAFSVRVMKRIQRFVGRRAELIIVPSDYLKRVVQNWGTPPQKITVVHSHFNGVSANGSRRTLRALVKVRGPFIISAGRFVPWKGFLTLIKLMPNLLKQFPEAKLMIAGDGPELDGALALVEELKLHNSVILPGSLDKGVLHGYIKAADLFVLNTFYEGFSHLLLEVMVLKTPIITTNVGGNPELIESGKHGALVRFNDTKALQKNIVELLKDRAKAGQLTEAAYRRVNDFRGEKALREMRNLLQTI